MSEESILANSFFGSEVVTSSSMSLEIGSSAASSVDLALVMDPEELHAGSSVSIRPASWSLRSRSVIGWAKWMCTRCVEASDVFLANSDMASILVRV
ncbi:hypothetical protein ACFFPK_14975 [Glutamicibacter nicotianae]|uniref:hypothetical protein n=1 Tax=Glutamicibacter nicotianae TaxID=37929 RepID=UPI0011416C4F|nr:hypothetical protein [Glutamicibacter nicotianae]